MGYKCLQLSWQQQQSIRFLEQQNWVSKYTPLFTTSAGVAEQERTHLEKYFEILLSIMCLVQEKEKKKKRWRVPMLAKQDPQWNINWRPEQQRRWSGWGRYSYERMQEKIWSGLAQISLALGVAVKWRAKSLIVSLWAQTLSVAEPSSILLPFWFKNETSRQVLLSTGKVLEVASEKY